jgi:hypothetical protein
MYKLTSKSQYSHHDKDGAYRNHILYFLNNVLIFKQKLPFDTNLELGFDRRTSIFDEYILNGKMYQKRIKWEGCSHSNNDKTEIREVSFPLSKKRLEEFNIPIDFKVIVSKQ